MTNAFSVNKVSRVGGIAFFPLITGCGRVFLIFWFAIALLFISTPQVQAQGSVRYEAVDLADVDVGEDLWEYSYYFSGYDFGAGQGFSIYFEPQLYKSLQNPRPSSSLDWNMIVVQPDVLLSAAGFLDGLALVNQPPTGAPFQVSFVWLGQGAPGEQPFEIYDVNFQTLSSGASVVPEPSALLLGGLGGLVLLGGRALRCSKNKKKP